MRVVETFPRSYVVDTDPGWPERGERLISISSHEPLGMHSQRFANLRFYPNGEASWVGQFEHGVVANFDDVILATANPATACLVVGGAGYWIDVSGVAAKPLECLPITQAFANEHLGAILIITWRDILVFDSPKPRWMLQAIADDHLKVSYIEGNILAATGFLNGEDVKLQIDLDTRRILECKPFK